MAAVPPVNLSNVNGTLLPPTITGPIFTKAAESSAVMQLARKVPLSLTAQTAVPIPMDIPTAGWVAEGGSKPTSSGSVGVKTMAGKKVAVLIPVSQEVAMTNAAALYDQLQQDLPTAIARAFDYAAIHGLDLASGGSGPFGDYLAATPHTVTLGSTAQANGGIYADLVKGEQTIVQTQGYELTGFAADPRLKPELKLATDTMGRPLWVDNPAAGLSGGNLIGYPAYYNPGVSGRLYRQSNHGGDSGLRAIGGDWSQCAWGQGMDLTIKVSTQANYVDSNGVWHSAFQENLVLLLAEAYYGFVVNTTDAFVKYQGQIGS